jgi:hypothetical protein
VVAGGPPFVDAQGAECTKFRAFGRPPYHRSATWVAEIGMFSTLCSMALTSLLVGDPAAAQTKSEPDSDAVDESGAAKAELSTAEPLKAEPGVSSNSGPAAKSTVGSEKTSTAAKASESSKSSKSAKSSSKSAKSSSKSATSSSKSAKSSSKSAQSSSKSAKSSSKSSKSSRPATAKECSYLTPVYEHTVEPGEHIGLIAGYYGVTRADLVALNQQFSDPNHIRPGQAVNVCPQIPPRELVVIEHSVGAGETLGSIARHYEIEIEALAEMQQPVLTNRNVIRVGQLVRIEKQGDIIRGFEPRKQRRGALSDGVRLASAAHYVIKRPNLAYGTPRTIKLLGRVLDRYHRRASGGPKLHVGDLSQRGGGPLRGHVSHQHGTDVDIGLVLKGKDASVTRFVTGTDSNLDLRRTWALVHEFLRTGQVRYIFLDYALQKRLYKYALDHGVSKGQLDEWFQYPRGKGRGHGIVRHWKNHRDHIHVRFRG